MGSNFVIVAIPAVDDNIWKVSSEKIPHLTLLALGDAESNPNTNRIMQFVSHAVNVCEHGEFMMRIDYRSILGDDKADVVFFEKNNWSSKWITEFRSQLLQNTDIRAAYESTEQFPEWRPHLTLGYSETPAKSDHNGDDRWVSFDRIAVWTRNYEGPEFRLKWPDREDDMAVAYSEVGEAAVADLLHVGVKGMRWGVRKARATEEIKSKGQKVSRGIKKASVGIANFSWEISAYSSTKHAAVHNTVADEIGDKVYLLQTSPKYRGKSLKTDKNLANEYEQDVAKVTQAAYKRAVKEVYGENFSGTKEARYVDDARGSRIEIRDKKTGKATTEADLTKIQDDIDEIEHAEKAPDITIPVNLDSEGYISEVGMVSETELSQSTTLGEQYILEHFGTKGMKWGVRNKRELPVAVAPIATSKVPPGAKRKTKIETEGGENHPASEDAIKVAEAKTKLQKSGPAALTNKELQAVANRVELEDRVRRAVQPKGKKFVFNVLKNQGNQGANQYINKRVTKKFAS